MGEHPTEAKSKRPDLLQPILYRARNLIERFFNKIKQCRRVATRCDKLAANYLAFIKLASIRVWLRANESAPWLNCLVMNATCCLHKRYGGFAPRAV
jgi:Transposase DDE domain